MGKSNTQLRDIGRKRWLLNSFRDYQCQCGEAELVCLEWFPHHKKIRGLVMRHGAKSKQRQQAIELIEQSIVIGICMKLLICHLMIGGKTMNIYL